LGCIFRPQPSFRREEERGDGMMTEKVEKPEDLTPKEMVVLIMDLIHRTIVHHTLWFSEVEHQLGLPRALALMDEAWRKTYPGQMKRLAEIFGFDLIDGMPAAILSRNKDELIKIMEELGKNWLAADGIWFQTVESCYDMGEAKRCNDSCWVKFSPFEAVSIKKFLNLPELAGLEGLKKALRFRLYACINKQAIVDDTERSIIFSMNDCRVQSARMHRGLADYPCKSAGLVEYRTFAETIDARLHTECIGCPPDSHPQEWFCSWRFSLPE
jgi:hypothetical protein